MVCRSATQWGLVYRCNIYITSRSCDMELSHINRRLNKLTMVVETALRIPMVIQMKGKTLGGGIHSGRRRSTFASFSFATAGRRAFKTAKVLTRRLQHTGSGWRKYSKLKVTHSRIAWGGTTVLSRSSSKSPHQRERERERDQCGVGDTVQQNMNVFFYVVIQGKTYQTTRTW